MFLGEYAHTIDDKGRLTLPAKYRADLAAGLVVTRGIDKCLFVFPRAEWDKLSAKLDALPLTDPQAREFRRLERNLLGRKALQEIGDEMVAAMEVDGIFLDTMSRGAAEFRSMLDAVRPGVALEGEGALPIEHVHDHHMSWAQWFNDSAVPGVLRNKWFERRHLQHRIDRLAHPDELARPLQSVEELAQGPVGHGLVSLLPRSACFNDR